MSAEGAAAETLGAIGSLGPTALILIPIAAVVLVTGCFVLGGVVALTGVPRFRIPGLAWVMAGVWRELHGLRADWRAVQRNEPLPDLDPLSDSVPPPPAPRSAKRAPTPSRDEPRSVRPSKVRQPSRP